MKNSVWSWSRVLTFGCAVGLMFLAAGDSGRTQVVGPGVGIDPLQILDLQIKPNVLIVLDTSGSMRFPATVNPTNNANNGNSPDINLGGDDPIGKMSQAKDALNQVLTANTGKFNFGFAQYGTTNTGKRLDEPAFTDNNGTVGPLTYVSSDANADTWTGGGGDFFVPNTNSITGGTASQNAYNSFRPFNEVYDGPGCATGTACRRYLFSRVLRNNLTFRFNTASGATGLQAGFPAAFTCPKPPVGLFPQDPNVDVDPTTTDIQRPCFHVESTAAGNPGAVFFYTSGTWELAGAGGCAAAAVLENVANCSAANIPTIKGFLKPEMPVDGSCGDAVGVPCKMTPWVNVTSGAFINTNPATVQGANANAVYGIQAAQSTPLGGVLASVRGNFGTVFPGALAGQRHFVLLITDGDETCGGDAPTEATTNWNSTPRIETLVIGFGLNTTTLNQIARNGSGGLLDAFTATNTQELVDKINEALTQTSIAGEFSDQQTITESVFEYGATAGIDPRVPSERYTILVPLLLQSTFEMPGFVGHLNAFRNNAGASLQLWDAGDMLCKRVVGFPATTVLPAKCNTAAASVDATALGTSTNFQFAELLPSNTGAPRYEPTGCAVGTRCIKRRIFTTARNGVFAYGTGVTPGASQQPSDNGPTVPLWPPSATATGVNPTKTAGTFPNGLLDAAFGIDTMDFTALQTAFGACRNTGGDPQPSDCTSGTVASQTQYARKEAREMILAYTAGASVVRDPNGSPRRDTSGSGAAPWPGPRGQIRYQARTWLLGDATLSGAAIVTPPIESKPGVGQDEYRLFRNGPRDAFGTPLTAPGNQMTLGFGLRNPDKDSNAATAAASQANVNLKPLMSIVYHAANDMLHAFRAGPQCAVKSPTTASCTAGFETGGEELYGFVPFDQLLKLRLILLQGQDRANHKYIMATPVRFGDVFIPGAYTDPTGTPQTGRWRTLLYVGRGIGGKYYTALDVTNPGVFTQASLTTTPPLVLWNRGNPDTVDGTVGGTPSSTTNTASPADAGVTDWITSGSGGAYTSMGQAWSVPAITRVDPTQNSGREFIIYVGSGYGSAGSGEGRSFYSLDPITGDILTQADVGSSTGSLIADNALVANPSVFTKEQLSAGFVPNPSANRATRVYIGDLHGRVWKFLTGDPGTAIRVQDFGVDQPIANGLALLNYNGDGTGAKPHIYVEMGNDRRVPTPPALAPPPVFKLAGLRDNGSDTDTTIDNATVLFTFNLPDRFRGTIQAATAFNSSDPTTAKGRVFMAATRFNPVTASNCQSTFDSLIFAVGAESGNAAYDLNNSGGVTAADVSSQLTGKFVKGVQVAFGQLTVDQGLGAGTAPVPPAPPPPPVTKDTNQVFTSAWSGGGTSVCR